MKYSVQYVYYDSTFPSDFVVLILCSIHFYVIFVFW